MKCTRTEVEINTLFETTQASLLSQEIAFPEKTYAQGIMDTLLYLAGDAPNPFDCTEA